MFVTKRLLLKRSPRVPYTGRAAMASLAGFADAKRSTPVATAQETATPTPSGAALTAPLAGFAACTPSRERRKRLRARKKSRSQTASPRPSPCERARAPPRSRPEGMAASSRAARACPTSGCRAAARARLYQSHTPRRRGTSATTAAGATASALTGSRARRARAAARGRRVPRVLLRRRGRPIALSALRVPRRKRLRPRFLFEKMGGDGDGVHGRLLRVPDGQDAHIRPDRRRIGGRSGRSRVRPVGTRLAARRRRVRESRGRRIARRHDHRRGACCGRQLREGHAGDRSTACSPR